MTGAKLYAGMSPKQRRVVNIDVALLFAPAAFMKSFTIDDMKRLGPWHPKVDFKGRTVFLSEKGVAARRRLHTTLCRVAEPALAVSKHEIYSEIATSHARFIERELEPTGEEFFIDVANRLNAKVKNFQFLALIDGLELKDVSLLDLGSVRIQRSDRHLFDSINFEGGLDRPSVFEHFDGSLWLVANVAGSPDIAAEEFRYRASLTIGLIAIYGSLQYRGAFRRTRACAIVPSRQDSRLFTLRWEVGGADPSLSINWGHEQDLPVSAESVAYVNDQCFFRELAALPDCDRRNELQNAILTSVYWFADAYGDRNPTMQFVKLWSCMECFFSIEKDGVTELNAKGIAAVLTHAGYNVSSSAEYPRLKARLKNLYDLRSQAVHGGKVGHVEDQDLETFSQWIAWVIVSMMSLSVRGYETLRRVHAEVSRLDALHIARADRAPSDLA